MVRFITAIVPIFLVLILIQSRATAQYKTSGLLEDAWVDSVFNRLTPEQKIAQLMVIRAHSNLGPDHVAALANNIKSYNIGGLCFFQGGPVRQANLTNYYQSIAATPLLITIDGEWGLGMRLDSVEKYPFQLTLGALPNDSLIYKAGKAIAAQCKRLGIHINYAPVVDINNNPANPVIGYRSFGENIADVSAYGIAYMKGMQDAGIMACAKHFPGHGDVAVDSHVDLPVINKSMGQLNETELKPFKAMIAAGVKCMMIAHLWVPAIDNTKNKASSISKNTVTGLLRKELGFNGLTFTDALEMKGVAKYFPSGKISAEALVAGNDMLCLPENIKESIAAIKTAIKNKQLSWDQINEKVLKVLHAKYQAGLSSQSPIDTKNLINDLNAESSGIRKAIAEKSITLLAQANSNLPAILKNDIRLNAISNKRIAYVGLGISHLNHFAKRIKNAYNGDLYLFSNTDTEATAANLVERIKKSTYDVIIIGIHNFSNRPAKNYGFSETLLKVFKQINLENSMTLLFGNVLATENFCAAKNLVICYQDDAITQDAAADFIESKYLPTGKLPVSVCNFKYGDGITMVKKEPIKIEEQTNDFFKKIDSVALRGIELGAYPGCVIMAKYKGSTIYEKAFGKYTYDADAIPVRISSIFDVASVTKVCATTIAVMKLYDEGKINLESTLYDYLDYTKGTNKSQLKIKDILLHQARLVPFISFYKSTLNPASGQPRSDIYSRTKTKDFEICVAKDLYLRNDWFDTLISQVVNSSLGKKNNYSYSDNDFIFLGDIVETITGKRLDEYVKETFYDKMGLSAIGYTPLTRFSKEQIVPTEADNFFRHQLLWGHVHDEGAAMFGGIAGHAGLFATAADVAAVFEMLLNNGVYNGVRYLNKSTVKLFTNYQSKISRRGYGFDKPEKDNAIRLSDTYPCISASPATFGHTGYTGTCVWADPVQQLVFVFLSNRVYPTRDNGKLARYNIRTQIQDLFYSAIAAQATN